MKKTVHLFFAFISIYAGTMYARTVSFEQAQLIAKDFFGDTSVRKTKLVRGKDSSMLSPYYIFNSDSKKGYVIISGDDRTPLILGYSNTDNFDSDNVPPGLQYLLNQYQTYIESLDENIDSDTNVENDTKEIIAPLLTTKWNQNEPYNACCPKEGDYTCPTGCVATAIAQIVNYHKWPDVGEGTFSYNMNGQQLELNYGNVELDWDVMSDEYNENSSVESCEEVAKLMYACGVGLETNYTLDRGSGSHIVMAKRFLVENFKYDANAKIVWRHNYLKNEWNDLMYDELKNSRPIYLQGGQHAFVCDGYNGDGYFHFNWGWSGSMDGYFLFSPLMPNEDDYSENLLAMINIKKREGDKQDCTFDIVNTGDFTIESYYPDYVMINMGLWHNYTRKDFNGKSGIEIENTETLESSYILYPTFISGAVPVNGLVLVSGSGESAFFNHRNSGLVSGLYKLYPIYTADGSQIIRVRCIAGGQNHIDLTITEDGEYIYSNTVNDTLSQVEVIVNRISDPDDLTQPLDVLDPSECLLPISYTVKNLSELPVNDISVGVYNQNDVEMYKTKISTVYEPEKEVNSVVLILGTYLQPGIHYLVFYDKFGNVISNEPFYFQVQGESPQIEATYVKFKYKEPSNYDDRYYFDLGLISYHDKYCQPGFNIIISKNGNEVFETILYSFNYEAQIFGETDISFALTLGKDNLLYGEYQMDVYDLYGNRLNKDTMSFSVESTGLENVDRDNLPTTYYNLQGVKVENPSKGVFIKKQEGKATKVVID